MNWPIQLLSFTYATPADAAIEALQIHDLADEDSSRVSPNGGLRQRPPALMMIQVCMALVVLPLPSGGICAFATFACIDSVYVPSMVRRVSDAFNDIHRRTKTATLQHWESRYPASRPAHRTPSLSAPAADVRLSPERHQSPEALTDPAVRAVA
jgi:hypothetical protein